MHVASVAGSNAQASYINGDEIIVDGGSARTIMNLVPRPGHGA